MLPLWIIDLNSDTKRCELFQERLLSISGALLSVSNISEEPLNDSYSYDIGINTEPINSGGQWYYSHFDNPFLGVDFSDEEEMADLLYDFKEKVVLEGQRFVTLLRKSAVKTDININICVVGHIEEQMSQMTFASIASLFQLEKGRILPNHIHQGVNIMGMLYIPSAVNTRKRAERQKVLRCLREIEVQHQVTSVHGYDKMMYFQDVQNKTQKQYAQLDTTGQVDYVTQCIVNLFYATNECHPLLSGSSSDEHFYLSMGPASIFYDPTMQDLKDLEMVSNGVISTLKSEGLGKRADTANFVSEKDYNTTKVLCDIFKTVNLDLTKVDPADPDPHPIRDFLYKPLKRRYYGGYLSRFPSLLMNRICTMVADQTRETLEKISILGKEKLTHFTNVALPYAVHGLLVDCNQNTGAIFRIERHLVSLKERIARKAKNIDDEMEFSIWSKIQEHVPKDLQDHFFEYHDDYLEDADNIRQKRRSTSERCESRKREAQNDLVNHLKKEPTVLSVFSRVFLYGIVLVLFFVPLLEILSPAFVDFGDVTKNAFVWAVAIFLLPSLWQLISFVFYCQMKRLYMRKLKAYYLHDAYARVVNAIRSEAEYFYSKAMTLCDEYMKRCGQIREDLKPVSTGPSCWKPDIPKMSFNQPLVDGVFGGKHLFPGEFVDYNRVMINQKTEFVNKLDAEDYFSIIRVLKEQMFMLFSNVSLPDTHERKVDEKTGRSLFLSVKEMKDLRTERWQKTIEQFNIDLEDNVRRLIVPRRLDTVDSKVLHYVDANGTLAIMKPFVEFCATNGELTADNCRELADVKCNDEKMKELVNDYLPFGTIYQFDKHDDIYKKFFFLTKWRTFDSIAANRILPEVELDLSPRDLIDADDDDGRLSYPYSSVFLYALCGKDATASIWLKLFRNEDFVEIADKNRFLDQLRSESHFLNKTLHQLD